MDATKVFIDGFENRKFTQVWLYIIFEFIILEVMFSWFKHVLYFYSYFYCTWCFFQLVIFSCQSIIEHKRKRILDDSQNPLMKFLVMWLQLKVHSRIALSYHLRKKNIKRKISWLKFKSLLKELFNVKNILKGKHLLVVDEHLVTTKGIFNVILV